MAIDPPLGPTLRTDQAGAIVVPNTATLNFVSGATVARVGTQANVTVTGSGGTVTSIAPGDATLTFSPNPITGTGTIVINLGNPNTWNALQTFAANAIVAASLGTTASSLTLNGGGANNGVIIQANGTTYADFGVTGVGFIAMAANTSLGSVGGTGGLAFSAMTGDTSLPSGQLQWAGASGKLGSLVSASILTLTAGATSTWSTTAGDLNVDAKAHLNLGFTNATQINIGNNAITTQITGNLTVLGTGAFTTGTGAATLNGDTTIASGKVFDAGGVLNLGPSTATAISSGKAGIGNSVLGFMNQTIGTALTVSGNAIAPTANIHHVGAGLIKTITVPATLTAGAVIQIIPDAAFTYDATGNIVVPVGGGLALINKLMTFAWDGAKWTPSY